MDMINSVRIYTLGPYNYVLAVRDNGDVIDVRLPEDIDPDDEQAVIDFVANIPPAQQEFEPMLLDIPDGDFL